MKAKLLLLLFGILAFTSKADNTPQFLVMWLKDGTKQTYLLDKKPVLNFTDTDILISTKEYTFNYSLGDIARFTYENNSDARLDETNLEESIFRFDGENLYFSNRETYGIIAIYELDGKQVFLREINSGEECIIPLTGLKEGVYIVNVNGSSHRIIKK